jgi:hypothetical protein
VTGEWHLFGGSCSNSFGSDEACSKVTTTQIMKRGKVGEILEEGEKGRIRGIQRCLN